MVIRATFPDTYQSFQRSDLAAGHCALDFMKVSVVAEKAAKRWSPDAHEQENRIYNTRASERGKRNKERGREKERNRARKKLRDGEGWRERTVEAAAREERLRLRRYVVYVAGLQRGRDRKSVV